MKARINNIITAILNLIFGCFVPFRGMTGKTVFNITYALASLYAVLGFSLHGQWGFALLSFWAFWGVGALVLKGPAILSDELSKLVKSLGGRPRKDVFPSTGSPFQTQDGEDWIFSIMSDAGCELTTDDAIAIGKLLSSKENHNSNLLKGNYKQGDLAWWIYQKKIELFKNQTAGEITFHSNSPVAFSLKVWREKLAEILNPPAE